MSDETYLDGWTFAASGQRDNKKHSEAFEQGRAAAQRALELIADQPKEYLKGWKDSQGWHLALGSPHGSLDPDYARGVTDGTAAKAAAKIVGEALPHE